MSGTVAVLAAGAALVLTGPGAQASAATAQPDAAPGELIVRFSSGTEAGARAELRRRADVEVERALPVAGLQLVEVDPGQSVTRAADELEASKGVVYAEPNFYRRVAAVPNDPFFGELWGLDNTGQAVLGVTGTPDADIDAPEAWNLTSGSSEVTAAVVDTGVDLTHPDLADQAWTNPGESGGGREANGADDDGNGLVDDWRGWDWVNDDNLPADPHYHGSHVSGTIAASGNNGSGITGVSWRSRIMPLRVLDAQGGGTVADLISAYRYAAAKGARIVNASLGGSSFSSAERDAIASAPNTLFVVAAGNGGEDGIGDDLAITPTYPCAYTAANIVCVAASNQSDGRASFSNYGASAVDLAAPGVRILSTVPGGGFAYLNGTSMATPHAAGAAALLWALRPGATVANVKGALLDGVDPVPAFGGRTVTGGRLNAERSLRLIGASSDPPAPAPQPTPAPAPEPNPAPAPSPEPGAPERTVPEPVAPAPTPAPGPPPLPSPLVDRSAPALFLRAPSPQRLRTVFSRGLLLRVRCSEACGLGLRLTVDARTARRLGLSRTRRPTALGSATRRLGSSGGRVAVKLSRRARLRLRRTRRLTVVLTAVATDRAGNARRVERRLVLRR